MRYSIRIAVICLIVLTSPTLVLAAKTHRVKKSESLYSLAKKYHVSLPELKSANNLVSNHVKAGDTLIIPPRSSAGADRAGKSATSSYKVRKGDTLARIARKTGVSVSELKRLNSLAKKKVKPGQVLVLKDAETEVEVRPRVARKIQLRYNDLFSEKDYEQSLAELTDPDPDKPVELSKNLELKADSIKMLKNTAYGFLGTRYRFGGSSRSGIDCSSFVQKVFRELEVSLPRTAREQFQVGNEVSPGDLQKGDLIFFRTYAPFPSHVGIYLGDNRMIHASSRDRRVVISPMNTPYYRARFIGAKRIDKINPETFSFDDLIAGIEEESAEDTQLNDTLGLTLAN
ncbi:MAG: NlpC/P60 family protein [Geobacteraceae bacterium]|nr:NlpC/P60 family protein [Geobacteraceae bacterium]